MTVKQNFLNSHGEKWNAYTANKQGDFVESYQNPQLIEVKDAKKGAFVITYTDRFEKPCAEFYESARVKNSKSFYFRSVEQRTRYIKEWIATEQRYNKRVAEERKNRANQSRGLVVGDVLSAVWGYDQTNYNYYQVTKLIGKTMVEVREIAQMRKETGYMQGECAPAVNEFISEPMRRKARDGAVKISDSQYASKCSYKEIAGTKIYDAGHYTSYA